VLPRREVVGASIPQNIVQGVFLRDVSAVSSDHHCKLHFIVQIVILRGLWHAYGGVGVVQSCIRFEEENGRFRVRETELVLVSNSERCGHLQHGLCS
jgi:hypothetical protein